MAKSERPEALCISASAPRARRGRRAHPGASQPPTTSAQYVNGHTVSATPPPPQPTTLLLLLLLLLTRLRHAAPQGVEHADVNLWVNTNGETRGDAGDLQRARPLATLSQPSLVPRHSTSRAPRQWTLFVPMHRTLGPPLSIQRDTHATA